MYDLHGLYIHIFIRVAVKFIFTICTCALLYVLLQTLRMLNKNSSSQIYILSSNYKVAYEYISP